MRFSKVALLTLLSSTLSLAQINVQGEKDAMENGANTIVVDQSDTVEKPVSANITITYTILERPPYHISEFLEFETEDVATLNYTITNNQNTTYILNAVGGTIRTYDDSEIAANITAGKFEQVLYVGVNQTVSVQQRVTFLNMKDGDYYIQPKVYFQEADTTDETEDNEIELGAQLTLMTIMKPPMSFFNPQFLSIQIVLFGAIGSVSYFFMNYTLKGKKKKSTTTQTSMKPVDPSSFLPDQYKK